MRVNSLTVQEFHRVVMECARRHSAMAGAASDVMARVISELHAKGYRLDAYEGTEAWGAHAATAQAPTQDRAPVISPSAAGLRLGGNAPPPNAQQADAAAFGPGEFANPSDLG